MPEKLPEGTVTLLFTDVEGSTALRTGRGDETAHARLQTHVELVRRQLQEHRGHEVKTMGDGFMAAFASARAAVECAVGIQQRLDEDNRGHPAEHHVRVRAGLHTGEVVREDGPDGQGDLFGEAVNAAARIMAKATGGQILVSETLRGVLGHGRETELLDRGRFRLKGFPERWRLYEVLWRSKEEPAAAVAPVLAERTPYVGREEERAELRRRMEQAIAGHGSIVLIRGEPGVGKTRLAQELILEARARGMFDSTGRCYEMEGAPPYIPYIEMLQQSLRRGPAGFRIALGENAGEIAKILPELRQVFDDIPPPLELPPEQERLYLFNSIREFLERVSHTLPLLHVLDDLHWADDATLMLLQHIAQHQDKMAVLTVATYRDIELDAARPFARTLESLVRQRLAHRIALKPLPEGGVEAMLRALTGQPPPPALVQAIYRETEGNPFFVEEVFQHLSEQGRLLDSEGRWRSDLQVGELDVPEGVRLVISRRLERVSEECRTALADAAVVGRDFGFDLLQKLSEVDADTLLDAIDEAERANLIVAADDVAPADDRATEARFRFAHELIRQTLISGLSLPRRQRLHLRVAETMELVYGKAAETYAADMAHHLYQAGAGADPAKTARYLVLAGDQALQAAAFGQALRDYDAAFAFQPADDRAARADLFYKRGLARRSLDRWDEALADWREAADSYERLGNAEAAARTFESMCYQVLYGQHFAEALELSLRGLAAIGRRDNYYRARLLGWGGLTLSLAGFYSAGDAMIRRGEAMVLKLNDDGLIGLSFLARATHHWPYLEVREAAEAGRKSAELLRKTGQLWYLADALFYTSLSLIQGGRLEESSQIFRELAPLAERLGHTVWSGGDYEDIVAGRTGDFDASERFWRQFGERARGRQHSFWLSQSELFLGAISFWRGRWQEAFNSFQAAAEKEPSGVFFGMPAAYTLLVRAYEGHKESALAALRVKGAATARARADGGSAASLLMPMLRAARNSGLGLGGLVGLIRESRSLQTRGPLPRPGRSASFGESTMLFAAIEGLAVLGERTEAAKLYPLVLERMKTGNIARPVDFRLLETVAGIAAGAGGKWAEAEGHFQTAMRRAEEMPHVIEQPEVRRFYARMLLDRDGPGDREKARDMLTEAVEMYRSLGMPKHVEMAEAMLGEC
jgi:class 3 adenylate cyclase/tetratricopeptide (TPR) repeat protein